MHNCEESLKGADTYLSAPFGLSALQDALGITEEGREVRRGGWEVVLPSRPPLRTTPCRGFALLGGGTADAAISCRRAKYDYAYWRPITAIRLADTDGNRATKPDPAWASLVQTPPYPDYVSGHACATGAATETFGKLFGKQSLDLVVTSTVTGMTRHFNSTKALDAGTMNARIWLGLHFRRATTDGNGLGHAAASWMINHELQRR